MISTIFWSVGAFLIGAWAGTKLQMWVLQRALKRFMIQEMMANASPYDATIHVEIIKEGDSFILYNADTHEFLAQGKTPEQVNSVLRERFPRTYFTATFENARDMGYLNNERL